jgi:hypothetical protein
MVFAHEKIVLNLPVNRLLQAVMPKSKATKPSSKVTVGRDRHSFARAGPFFDFFRNFSATHPSGKRPLADRLPR